jgi:hypothetical protein
LQKNRPIHAIYLFPSCCAPHWGTGTSNRASDDRANSSTLIVFG